MVIGHSNANLQPNTFEFFIFQFIHLTTRIFMSVSDILAFYKVQRDKLSKIITLYIIIFSEVFI